MSGTHDGDNSNGTALLIEDEVTLRNSFARFLKANSWTVFEAGSCADAYRVLDQEHVDLIVTDLTLPDGLGFELIGRVAARWPRPGIIVMTGSDRTDDAVKAIRYGAADFLVKPCSFETFNDAIQRATRRRDPLRSLLPQTVDLELEPTESWRERYAPSILGAHPTLMRVFYVLERVADTDCSILVTGESGTGKELVARALHEGSERRDKPFVTVNCAAIPENLIESELFGHAKGSFTGALASRTGRFVAADGGTIFLDEIGELPLGLQAKLLRVLQEKEVCPLGFSKSIRVDVRVVAATNRDLDEMVAEGTFREDLLYRLNVIPVELPALRERATDIPDLVRHFIRRSNERFGRNIVGVTKQALSRLQHYEWPGNIRQLENAVQRMVVLRPEGEIDVEDLPKQVRAVETRDSSSLPPARLPEEGLDLRDAVERFENQLILQALERTQWNKNQAALMLQMNRTTLVEKLKKKGLEPDAYEA